MTRQSGLPDLQERYGKSGMARAVWQERYGALSRGGEPLERLAPVVDFELFRPALITALPREDRGKGGRP